MVINFSPRPALAVLAAIMLLLGAAKPASAVRNVLQVSPSPGWQDEILSQHNNLRATHQAADLTWSGSLASSAQSWADQCTIQHSNDAGVGENLAWGTGYTVQQLVQLWVDEEQNYVYGQSDPSNFSQVGHFTQMVWQSTTEVGCGIADCSSVGWSLYIVCQYSPPGNYAGQYAENVLPPA